MILIGISGKKRSGKNTVAKLMAVHCVQPIKEFAFADALKDEVAKACGVQRKFIEENKQNFRLILQGWGTDFKRRLVDDNYWLLKLGLKLRMAPNDCIAVVTDVRFKNEADFIRGCGGKLIRVNRHSNETEDEHLSEIELDDYKFDFTLDNVGTLNNLSHDTRRLLHSMKLQLKEQ